MILGSIGFGNMASAMIAGIIEKKVFRPEDIVVSSATKATRERARTEFGVRTAETNDEVIKASDIVILAVKPQKFAEVIGESKESVKDGQLFISIAAGKTMADIEALFAPKKIKLVRVMPNTPAKVSEGMSGYTIGKGLTDDEKDTVKAILNSFGAAEEIPEEQFDVVTAVSGSSPAYVFMFIEALAEAGVRGGMEPGKAKKFAAQAVLGSAKLLIETDGDPKELREAVCSPGGTTIEAVKVLEERGFMDILIEAAKACEEKSVRMRG